VLRERGDFATNPRTFPSPHDRGEREAVRMRAKAASASRNAASLSSAMIAALAEPLPALSSESNAPHPTRSTYAACLPALFSHTAARLNNASLVAASCTRIKADSLSQVSFNSGSSRATTHGAAYANCKGPVGNGLVRLIHKDRQ